MIERCRLTVDTNLRITSWNKGLVGLRGKRSSEVRGVPYYEVLPAIKDVDRDAVLRVVQEGKAITLPAYPVDCFYGRVTGHIRIRPLKDKTGTLKGAEIIIEPHPDCMMYQNLEKCKPLVDIGKIASTLAHGVRNPLNAIKGAVVYLRERYASEKTLVEFTKMMEEEIARLDSFISKFLSSSLSEGGLSETDMNLLLKKIEVFISLQAQARNVRTCFEYADVPHLMIDSFHLEQAILNVINNALEAMPSGGQLTIRSRSEHSAGTGYVVIEVSDTGPGITEAALANGAIPVRENGRGFGLFITREVLRFYGGHLEVKSEKGVSTTVRLCLPSTQYLSRK